MASTAVMFTAAANARSTVTLPVTSADTALTKVFPWLPAASSAPASPMRSIGDEFALFAEEAREWADATMEAALENWPDWPDQ